MQIFLIGYIIIEICEIFTIGGFPLNSAARRAFSAVHIAAIISTLWILMMNGAVGYQLVDDGTALSLGLVFGSAALLFIGTGYIALDTGFSWTGYWDTTIEAPNRAYALYTLYQLVPLVFLVVFFILEAVLVLRVLGEVRPMCEYFRRRQKRWKVLIPRRLPPRRRSPLRDWPNFPIRRQQIHLHGHQWADKRRHVRNSLHTILRNNDMGILVQHNRRRLANARGRRQHVHIRGKQGFSDFVYNGGRGRRKTTPCVLSKSG